jgi:YebC/PmpR family DNA-binding regulatory protein
MSGHSKWSKVKHQKATTDVVKAAHFTQASRAIMVAVKNGGGITNPDDNFHLRLAIEKARAVNMPKENIERIIDKAKGEGGNAFMAVTYEGYAPHGVAIYIEGATDNGNRTVGFIKTILEHAGGSMASPGAVSYLFERKGVVTIPVDCSSYDSIFSIAVDAGALDVVKTADMYEVYTTATDVSKVKKIFEEKGIVIDAARLVMQPTTTIELSGDKHDIVNEVIERLEDLDDVQEVYSNLA